MWLVSYTTWLNSTLGSRAELITPGNMLLMTTGTILMKRVAQNKLTAPTEGQEVPQPRRTPRPQETSPKPQPPPKSKEQSYKEEVLSIVNNYNLVDEHTDYTVLE